MSEIDQSALDSVRALQPTGALELLIVGLQAHSQRVLDELLASQDKVA